MNITKAISRAIQKRKERGYDYLYWCIDIHGVILSPTYKLNNDGANFYDDAIKTLKLISADPINKIILWSSSYATPMQDIINKLNDKGVRVDYVNENPECPNTALCDFSSKLYFDILLDDKAGFEPEVDWKAICQFLEYCKDWNFIDSYMKSQK